MAASAIPTWFHSLWAALNLSLAVLDFGFEVESHVLGWSMFLLILDSFQDNRDRASEGRSKYATKS
jgi:hypothetical protein